ncbi:Cell division protein ZipA [wastewater metagenome]|uniref:Cell division protein ZipA n=2 Tax=unclassified sequences TaxID=12908 RepID=A0A5B8RDQ4_9ZZZZ|nr:MULTISPECIES: cell division protein ZipA [Arhodomonas]QEA04935.1 cell division protein ZipA [uncultured organism]
MDELRWLLIILGALVIVAIYLHGTFQNWRHDGLPWSRNRRNQREPFAGGGVEEPHLDDELPEFDPELETGRETGDLGREGDDDDRVSPFHDVGAEADPEAGMDEGDDLPAGRDERDFPAWAHSRVEGSRSRAEEWPVPEADDDDWWPDDDLPVGSTPDDGSPDAPEIEEGVEGSDAGALGDGGGEREPARRGRLAERLRRALGTDGGGDGSRGGGEAEADVPPGLEEKIVVINVLAPNGERFLGPAVQDALQSAGLTFGEHGIFHRYIEGSRGRVAEFSVANILNPGWFDLERMEGFETPGLAFFLRLPGPFDAVTAFEEMLEAARHVAGELDGQLLDARRCDLTHQAVEHLREEMIEYRRRAHLARRQHRE